jgi:hypothetical protein
MIELEYVCVGKRRLNPGAHPPLYDLEFVCVADSPHNRSQFPGAVPVGNLRMANVPADGYELDQIHRLSVSTAAEADESDRAVRGQVAPSPRPPAGGPAVARPQRPGAVAQQG